MNICICVSGQVRGSMEALKAFSKELEKLPDGFNISYIFSLWERPGVKLDGALQYAQMHRIFTPDLAKVIPISYYGVDFWKNFPQTREKMSEHSAAPVEDEILTMFPNSVVDIEKEILELEFSSPKEDKNSIKMLYKRWRCNEIKKKLERNTQKFDLVLVARPDAKMIVNPNISIKLGDDVIYVPDAGYKDGYTNDIMAFGSSKAIDKYCSLFSRSVSLKDWSNIHAELNKHIKKVGIRELPAEYFAANGLERNSLIELKSVINDNEFIKSIYESNYDIESLNSFELISVNMKKYLDWKGVDDRKALKYIILSDFSNRQVLDNKGNRNQYLYRELLNLFVDQEIDSIEDILKLEVGMLLNDQAKENLDLFFISKKDLKLSESKIIIGLIRNKKIEQLLDINNCVGLPSHLAVGFRDLALELETEDLESAFHLMKLAKDIRPGGPLIGNKLDEYTMRLREL